MIGINKLQQRIHIVFFLASLTKKERVLEFYLKKFSESVAIPLFKLFAFFSN